MYFKQGLIFWEYIFLKTKKTFQQKTYFVRIYLFVNNFLKTK